jgi:hypothetical protein
LVKVVYSRLFDWLVGRINASIGQDPAAFASIGLLDIYGFESFTFNDLEQVRFGGQGGRRETLLSAGLLQALLC